MSDGTSDDNASQKTPAQPTQPPPDVQPGAGGPGPSALPLPPGIPPQIAGALLGIQVNQPHQNPAITEQICNYLSHDSDNRLKYFEIRSKRGHTFRMAILGAITLLVGIILAIPLTALARGDMVFVSNFFDKYFEIIIMVVLALLGGGKLSDLLR